MSSSYPKPGILASLLACILTGCFVVDALPLGPDTSKKSRRPAPAEAPPTPPALTQSPSLPPERLARRLAMDLALRLPNGSDGAIVASDPEHLPLLVDSMAERGVAALALSHLHPRMWGLNETFIPVLESFAADDQDLNNALNLGQRRRLIEEPEILMRHVLSERLPFSWIFTAPLGIAHLDAVTFWNKTEGQPPWAESPYRFYTHPDGRPSAGLLTTDIVLAQSTTSPHAAPETHARRLLETFACQSFENTNAHLFHELAEADLAGDLKALATARAPCLGCHAQFTRTGAAFAGLGSGVDLATWQDFSVPDTTTSGVYAGSPFTGLEELGGLIGADPRTHLCEIERLITVLYQRPVGARDRKTVSLALDQLAANDMNLIAAIKPIFYGQEYSLAPVMPATQSLGLSEVSGGRNTSLPDHERSESSGNRVPSMQEANLYDSSGVRFLRRKHWQALVAELAPGAVTTDFPAALDPGHDEELTSDWAVPSGSYWHALDKTARQAAAAIVDSELRDGVLAVHRRLLTDLPDGFGVDASITTIYLQIRSVWRRLAGEELPETSLTYANLQQLWAEAKGDGGPEAFRRAWQLMLVAILTHPQIMTY